MQDACIELWDKRMGPFALSLRVPASRINHWYFNIQLEVLVGVLQVNLRTPISVHASTLLFVCAAAQMICYMMLYTAAFFLRNVPSVFALLEFNHSNSHVHFVNTSTARVTLGCASRDQYFPSCLLDALHSITLASSSLCIKAFHLK